MTPQTWHYGLIAEWWASFNVDGPEIDAYGRWIAEGQPALDAGCGTGRLLVPWLQAGYDVDGCDVSEDMLRLCRERARREGFEPTLWTTPLHELAPPRSYRTIVCCGTFGLGSTREQDEEALRRLREALEPGGVLLLDHEHEGPARFEAAGELPEAWPEDGARDRAEDGNEYRLRARKVAVDAEKREKTLEIRAEKWDAQGAPVAEEVHEISIRSYGRDELRLLIERAGFASVEAQATDDEPTVLYLATA